MSATNKNLMNAFAGESQANRKYLAYAKVADKEGLKQTAKLFRAVAEAETIHAHAHLKNAGKIGNTLDNLKDALAGEVYEHTEMYPAMIKDAQQEEQKKIESYFGWVNKVEEVHANLYKNAISAEGKIAETEYYICSVCGYTHEGPHEKNCPVCNMAPAAFYKFEG